MSSVKCQWCGRLIHNLAHTSVEKRRGKSVYYHRDNRRNCLNEKAEAIQKIRDIFPEDEE